MLSKMWTSLTRSRRWTIFVELVERKVRLRNGVGGLFVVVTSDETLSDRGRILMSVYHRMELLHKPRPCIRKR